MRKLIIILAIVIGGLLALGIAAVLLIDVNQYREPIRAQLEKRLKRSVSIGQIGLKIIPLAVRLDDLAIGDTPQFGSQAPFLSAKETLVRVGLFALLNKQVNVESLQVVQPSVELIRNAAGDWNFETLGSQNPSAPKSGGGSGTSVDIADLRIEDGRIAITDLMQKRPRAVYDHIDIGLRHFAPGKRFDLDAQVHLPGTGKQMVTVQLSADTPVAGKSLLASRLDGNVALEAVSMAGLQAFLGSAPSSVAKAVFNGKAQISTSGNTLSGKGNLDVTDPRLKDPARLEFEMRGDADSGVVTIPSAQLKLGGLTAHATGQVQTKQTPSVVTADVRADNAAVADLLSLASALGVAEGISGTGVLSVSAHVSGPLNAPAYDANGVLRDAKLTLDSLRKPLEIQTVDLKAGKDQAALNNLVAGLGSSHLRGNVSVHNFAHPDLQFNADIDKLDTAELQQMVVPSTQSPKKSGNSSGPMNLTGAGNITVGSITYNQIALTDVHATCKLDKGVIRLDPLSAKAFGGEQAGSIAVDTSRQETAFDVHTKLQNVDANKLLSAVTSVRQILFGTLSGNVDVRANPRAGQELAQALNGTVKVQLNNGKLVGVQLLNEMASIGKFLGFAGSKENATNIVKLGGTLNIQNGVANTDDLQMEFDGGSMAAAGTMGLADRSLNLRVTTVVGKAISQSAGGTQIGGFMSTALANSKGELVIPALVTGTFDKPHFAPDVQRVAKMKLDGLLPTQGNPGSAASRIQGILGGLTGAKAPAAAPAQGAPGAAPQQPQKKPGFQDIIDALKKKNEKK